jgi:pimeloyl-ACP methyl ester carboxylesterase
VHGLANYLWVWKWNIAALQENHRCIAIDLPGNGFSSRGDYAYSIDFYVSCLLEFAAILKLNKVTLVGHSMGGQIALRMALLHPMALKHLILIAPAGLEYFNAHEAMMYSSMIQFGSLFSMDEAHIAQSIQSSFYAHPVVAEEIIKDLNAIIQANDRKSYRRMIEKCISSMLSQQVFHKLGNIEIPVLILFGEQDQLIPNRFLHPVTPHEIAIQGAKKMKHAHVAIFKKAGHFVHIEKANEVNSAIQLFLQQPFKQ